MRWLHCLLHDRYQVFTQCVQVNLFAQGGTEIRDDIGSVILASLKTAIDDSLNTMTQGLEEDKNGKG
jgi:hypothetical protein